MLTEEIDMSEFELDEHGMTAEDRKNLEARKAEAENYVDCLHRALNAMTLGETYTVEGIYGKPMERWNATQKAGAVYYAHHNRSADTKVTMTDVEALTGDEVTDWVVDWGAAHPKAKTSTTAKALKTSKQHGPQR